MVLRKFNRIIYKRLISYKKSFLTNEEIMQKSLAYLKKIHKIILKGGVGMSHVANPCNPCNTNVVTTCGGFYNTGSKYAFVLVLFILLVIVGAAFWF